ncbi:lamin tail domain-containing protein [Pontiellaceae bacterium B12227]|nr:lamin tail domain-containing protein [Pontiellaceae bacterium B12227]
MNNNSEFQYTLLVTLLLCALQLTAQANIRINEICADSSDRLLRWSDDNRARLGSGASWYEAGFNAQYWETGNGPMGHGTSGIATDLTEEMENTPSLYLRQIFPVSAGNAASSQNVLLDIGYNDGFVAYLNGVEILRKNTGGTGAFVYHDQIAFNSHSSSAIETYTVGVASALLQIGDNILAVQAHNNSGSFFIDASLRMSGGTQLATSTGPWEYFVGNHEPSGGLVDHSLFDPASQLPLNAWTLINFDDASWATGPGGIGFGDGDDNTDVEALVKGKVVSVYMRRSFNVDASTAGSSTPLTFMVDYDDGYIAYVNGVEIKRSANMGNPGDFVPYNTTMGTGNEVGTPETFTLSAANTLLVEGENVMAIQVHNKNLTSSDMSMIADLDLGATALVNYSDDWNYFIGTEEPVQPPEAVAADDDLSDFADWVELENTGPSVVALEGWSLTDNVQNPDKWMFPDVTIAPNERIVILCTGRDLTNSAAPYLHTDFKLSAGGEYVGLYNAGKVLVSEIAPEYPAQDWRHTYGWDSASASYKYLKEATPGQANSTISFAALPTPPDASHESGFYGSAITVTLSAAAPATDIYYTLDGSTPSTTLGTQYTGEIPFSAAGVLRAVSVTADGAASDPVTYNYLIDVPEAIQSVPVICLTGDWDTGIHKPHGVTSVEGGSGSPWVAGSPDDYNMPMMRGRPYERRIHMNVLYTDTANHTNFQTDCGMRLAGSSFSRQRFQFQDLSGPWSSSNATTEKFHKKPQFNLFFRDTYGESRFNNPLFGDPETSLKSIRVRSGKNDIINPFIIDEVVRRLQGNMGQVVSRGTIAALYVNGLFRHYYNPVPRYDENFFQKAFNSDRDFDVVNHGGLVEGDMASFNEMIAFANANDLSIPGNYREMERRLDIENFIDYLLAECYSVNWDWPNNNWTASRERSANGRWRYHVWDAEGSFASGNHDANAFTGENHSRPDKALNSINTGIAYLYRALHDSDIFRQHWYDRAWKHLAPGGVLSREAIAAVNNELADELDPLMQHIRGTSVNRSKINDFASARGPIFIDHLRTENLWFDVEPPVFSIPGSTTTNGAQISLTHSNAGGTIYYSFDGEDPRGPGGTIVGTQYAAPITIDRSRHIKARVLKNGVWGALAEETYLTLHPKLLISEIMYNPADPPMGSPYNNDDFEFIELYNSDSAAIPLPPVVIDNGIAFNFSGGDVAVIEPGQFIVLVRNPEAFATRYNTDSILVAGTYTDKLSNSSDKLEMLHANYGTLVKGSYSDEWYKHTDGDGYSLNLRNLSAPGVFDEKATWKPSSVYGGSPGQPDPGSVPEPGAVVVNELLSHTDLSPVGDWIELFNTTDEPIDISGWTLSDDVDTLEKYVVPATTILPAYGYVTLNAANHFDSPAALIPFAFSEHGDEAVLTSPTDANGFLTGYRDDVDFHAAEREFTFGRHVRSDGKSDWTTLSASTPGSPNAYPEVGPVVLHEICYQPATNLAEYIQLYNITDTDVPLYDPLAPSNTWKISGGIDFQFPESIILSAHSALILCKGDPTAFRSAHSIPPGVQIFGPFDGALDNQGDTINLYRPGEPDELGTPWIRTARVKYNDKDPWPHVTNGMSSAIQRVYNFDYGNDPANWTLGLPGSIPKSTARVDSDLDGLPDQWEADHALPFNLPGDGTVDIDSDSMDNYSEYVAGTDPNDSNSHFRIEIGSITGEAIVVFDSIPATGSGYDGVRREYAIEYSPDLISPISPLTGATNIQATGSPIAVTNSTPTNQGFFRGTVNLVPE